MYASSLLSRICSPSQFHFSAVKRVLRYLQGTKDYGIYYTAMEDSKQIGYMDSEWAGCQDDMKSTSSYAFTLGSRLYSWASKKQKVVVLFSTETKYIVVAKGATQAISIRRVLEDIGEKQEGPTSSTVIANRQ